MSPGKSWPDCSWRRSAELPPGFDILITPTLTRPEDDDVTHARSHSNSTSREAKHHTPAWQRWTPRSSWQDWTGWPIEHPAGGTRCGGPLHSAKTTSTRGL